MLRGVMSRCLCIPPLNGAWVGIVLLAAHNISVSLLDRDDVFSSWSYNTPLV
jgi:hypothetical protein